MGRWGMPVESVVVSLHSSNEVLQVLGLVSWPGLSLAPSPGTCPMPRAGAAPAAPHLPCFLAGS